VPTLQINVLSDFLGPRSQLLGLAILNTPPKCIFSVIEATHISRQCYLFFDYWICRFHISKTHRRIYNKNVKKLSRGKMLVFY
jgi:hypothetical protein